MQAADREKRERLSALGKALRSSVTVPTDTYITQDLPLLLTRLSQVPASGTKRKE
ncbi:hypothetical protein KZ813_03355 [Sphingomonas sp. RHCKR7]|uniref:hypothetical protein n=1 Tax=Sphingomonas folli TaxID=2862497 RepID=UPI001CA5E8F9|nr:hypothetical protein [Sphingomonas folli]MBW6525866.1 hypothetical protein [Sphingomonas folli]